jgi:hypothetical protein
MHFRSPLSAFSRNLESQRLNLMAFFDFLRRIISHIAVQYTCIIVYPVLQKGWLGSRDPVASNDYFWNHCTCSSSRVSNKESKSTCKFDTARALHLGDSYTHTLVLPQVQPSQWSVHLTLDRDGGWASITVSVRRERVGKLSMRSSLFE